MGCSVLLIDGKVENIWDNEDFARMLRDKLGDDAEQYFRDACNPDVLLEDVKDFEPFCGGECDETMRIQERYERILHDVQDDLEAWDFDSSTKRELQSKRDLLWKRIDSEL